MLESFASALLAVSLCSVTSQSTTPASQWDGDYGRARANARSAHKPLLVVLDHPSDPQQRVAPVRHQTADGKAALLDAYELCHVDASTEYGRRVARAFQAEKLPYMAILDKTGRKIIYQHAGPMTGAQWQTALASHRRGELPAAASAFQAVPVNYSYFQQPLGLYDPTYCSSCQRGW